MADVSLTTPFPFPADSLRGWLARGAAAARLQPPWLPAQGPGRPGPGGAGGGLVAVRFRGVPLNWEIRPWAGADSPHPAPPATGGHPHFSLTTRVQDHGSGALLEEVVEVRAPLRGLVPGIGPDALRELARRLLLFRHRRLAEDLARQEGLGGGRPLRVVVSGASGLVGRNLALFLGAGGHQIVPLVRRPPRPESGEVFWHPGQGVLAKAPLEGVHAVVHLAGAGIAGGRWSTARKKDILTSRTTGTALLSRTLAALDEPPPVLVVASAVGYYGDTGARPVDEQSPAGQGFLAEVCGAWEAAAEPARAAGIRVVHLRTGMVLTPAGGALAAMLPAFRLGLGGRIGRGEQFMSWIELDDLLGTVWHLIRQDSVAGPCNAVSPHPVTNGQFTRVLGRVLGRPTPLPLPAWAVEAVFGEMGRELLLQGAPVHPAGLQAAGFAFHRPELEQALRWCLGNAG